MRGLSYRLPDRAPSLVVDKVATERTAMIGKFCIPACALLYALAQPAFAADAAVDAEITVRANRELEKLRLEIDAAQDRFIAKYNELNKDPQYAMKCSDEAPTGSRFAHHNCVPEFLNTATNAEMRAALDGHFAPPAALVTASKRAGFQQNMLDIASSSPELQNLARDQADLQARYDKLLRRTIGARPAHGLLTEESCSVVAAAAGEKPALQNTTDFSVLSLRPNHPLPIKAAQGVTISAIVCWRSDVRLAENDYLVVEAGFPLFIKETFDDESLDRTLVLERVGGQFRARLLSGQPFSADETHDVEKMTAQYNAKAS
jgi:hypothetical protein